MQSLGFRIQLPDPWQREALDALRAGRDVVLQAPTGAGKTYVFELFVESTGFRVPSVYTVPTRALANDKLLEWRSRGWNVGIQTGDLSDNVEAPVVVATLETQRGRILRGEGPGLLVIDEFQMLADPVRGAAYELAIALAPPATRLLLLSGSVANPGDVAAWLRRLGRDAHLVEHAERPVPLEEVILEALPGRVPERVRGFWPRVVGHALQNDLGPVLLFAPRRREAERLARQIAGALPAPDPLVLSEEQSALAGSELARLLAARVAFHHSGLSYAQRAGLVEPLAKAGQLRAVVATMGLAAGINFSLRTVAVTESSYSAGQEERAITPDELLQMFGRAGRRGLDERGYVLALPDRPRLVEARPLRVRRPQQLDWSSLIGVLGAAAEAGRPPFAELRSLTTRLFSAEAPALGCELSLCAGEAPCGLWVDAERARFAQSTPCELLGPSGTWEPAPPETETPLGECWAREGDRWVPALGRAAGVAAFPVGQPRRLPGPDKRYGRSVAVATLQGNGTWSLAPALRRLVSPERLATLGADTVRRLRRASDPSLHRAALALLVDAWGCGGRIVGWEEGTHSLSALLDFGHVTRSARRDSAGRALLDPPLRQSAPAVCRRCPHFAACRHAPTRPTPAWWWRRLGLIEPDGTPTRRGRLFSFFHHSEGLAIAAALEQEGYPIPELLCDLANLRAGHRFAHLASRADRLAAACRAAYGTVSIPGYFVHGLPLDYGEGAAEVLADINHDASRRARWTDETLRSGDVERALLEWRSLLRHIARAPELDWPRWLELRHAAQTTLEVRADPGVPRVPTLTAAQRRPVACMSRV